MNRGRCLLAVLATAGVLAFGFWWFRSTRLAAHATPEQCLDAFYQAAMDGKPAPYLDCLADGLRSRLRSRFPDDGHLADFLHSSTRDLKNWVQPESALVQGSEAWLEIDERRGDGRRRVKYRLEKIAGSWRIQEIGSPQLLPEHTPYGKHVKED